MRNIDYLNIQKASAIPGAAAMIETFRAIGYNLETAVADIVDNSISALAKNIYINRIWKGGNSIITIKDDGYGMSSEEIIQAMRPGAQNSFRRTLYYRFRKIRLRFKDRFIFTMSQPYCNEQEKR